MAQDLFVGHRPTRLPEDFKILSVPGVREGTPFLDFVKSDLRKAPPPPTPDYHPTAVYCICVRCKTVGNIMFPRGFSYGTGDAIMDGKIVKAICPTCKATREMRPLTPKDLEDNQLALLRRHYEIVKAWSIQSGSTTVEESAFVEAYERKYGVDGDPEKIDAEHRRRLAQAEAPDGKSRIVMP